MCSTKQDVSWQHFIKLIIERTHEYIRVTHPIYDWGQNKEIGNSSTKSAEQGKVTIKKYK